MSDHPVMLHYEEQAKGLFAAGGKQAAKGGMTLLRNPPASAIIFAVALGLFGGGLFVLLMGVIHTLFAAIFKKSADGIRARQASKSDHKTDSYAGPSPNLQPVTELANHDIRQLRKHYFPDG